MKYIAKVFFLFLAVLFGLLLPGCGQERADGGKEIILAAGRDLVQGPKDPYFSTVILKTWESLVGISDDGHEYPMLAESWEANPDKTEWIFNLRKNITFHDGEPFNAEAVVHNFHRFQHMGYRPSSFYGFLIDRNYPGLIKAEADGPYRVHLYFKKPVPMLIYRMAGWGSAMFSPKCFDEETGNWTDIAKGTGPFRIVEFHPDSYSVIERFDGYHGKKARAERIKIRTIPSPDARYSAMRSGEIDGVLDLGGLTPLMIRELERTGKFENNSFYSTISHYLTINNGRFPFSDERMRKALNLAIDRNKIVKYYFAGFGTPTRSFLNSTNPFAHRVEPVYDPAKAEELAKEVLGNKRCEVKMLLPQYGAARYPYKVICEFIQAELKPLGLDVKITLVDGMEQKKLMGRGDYDMSIGTRGLGNLDPTSLMQEFFSTNGTTNQANHILYSNPKIDSYFEELSHTYEIEDRRVIYDKIGQELLDHPAVVPLLEDHNIAVYTNRLAGYKAAVYGVTLADVHWKEAGE